MNKTLLIFLVNIGTLFILYISMVILALSTAGSGSDLDTVGFIWLILKIIIFIIWLFIIWKICKDKKYFYKAVGISIGIIILYLGLQATLMGLMKGNAVTIGGNTEVIEIR